MTGAGCDLPDLAATARLAEAFARALPNGGVLRIDGPLGAGKTTFVAAFVRALGGDAPVTSPTYVLAHEYPSPGGPIIHVDAYRLPAGTDLESVLDVDDALDRARAIVIEWAERLSPWPLQAPHLILERVGAERRARWTGIEP